MDGCKRKSDGMLDLTDWGRGRVREGEVRGEEHLPSNTFLGYGRRDKEGSWVFLGLSLSARKQRRSAADNEAPLAVR